MQVRQRAVIIVFRSNLEMKLLVFAALVGLAFSKVDYSGHQVYRAFPREDQFKILKTIGDGFSLDIWSEAKFTGDFVDFRVPPNLKDRIDVLLTRNRIAHEIFIEDLQFALNKQTRPRPQQMDLAGFQYDVYHTYDEIDQWITDFAASSSLVTDMVVGTGKSFEGRNMRAVKISTGEDRPGFVINCGIHAREWVSPATCLWVANNLVQQYNIDGDVTSLMNRVDFYFIPTSNPDGYAYTFTDERMWRKTRTPGSKNGCAVQSCDGVDPNRNWGYEYVGSGSSTNCCSDSYRGPSAFSEIETQNQRDFVNGISNIKGYIDVHAYSQLWMFPWGYTTALPKDYDLLDQIGLDSVRAIGSVHGKVYESGTIANTIYVANGSTADYFYSQGIVCSFAAELRDKGRYGFTLPENQIIPTAEETFAGLMTIASNIATGQCY